MIVTHETLKDVCDSLRGEYELAIDTETTGVEHNDVPFAVIIHKGTETFYFDERVITDLWTNPTFLDIFKHDHYWIYQNAKFDMRMLEARGIKPLTVHHDIAVQARIQKNDHFGERPYSLEAQGRRLGDNKLDIAKKYVEEHDLYETRRDYFGVEYKVPRYDRIPLDVMAPYAIQDARLTYKLKRHYDTLMDADDQRVMKMECELTPVVYKMERHGIRLDHDYTLKAYYHELGLLCELKDSYAEATGITYTGSAKSVQKSIEYQLPLTAKGNPSLKDDDIEDILTSNASEKDKLIVGLVRQIRHFDKRISTYYVSFLNKMHKGFIHASMWQGGTRTGRFSSSDPNIQNIPKEEDSTDPYVVRGCFIPRPGHVFVSMDYSQMEYRMMAAYAMQTDIIERVMSGEDFHKATAEMFGVSRKTAKTLNFMILYGGGNAKLALALGIPIQEAARLRTKYFMALPKVEQLIDDVIRVGRARGFVRNWLGRKLRSDYEFAYALPNHLIQGGGADIVKMAMVQIDKEFPHVKMIAQIHDQLIFDMKPEEFVHIPRIKEIMESIWTMNGMKLEVDVSWSERSLAERDMQKGIPVYDRLKAVQNV